MLKRLDYSWAILAAGFAVLFFSGGSRFAFGLMLRPMSEDLGVSRSALSLAVTVFMVVSAAAMPFVGRLVDRWSLRGTIALAAATGAAGLALLGMAQAPWQVFPVYGVVYALGNAGTSIAPVTVMVSQWFARRRGIATSAAVAGNAIGQLVIVAALAAALAAVGWRGAYTILAAANAIVLLPLALLVIRPAPSSAGGGAAEAPGEPEPPPLPLRRALTSRPFLLLVAIYTVCGFQDFLVVTHIVAFAQDQGVGGVLAGNLLAGMGLLGLLGILAAGIMADAFGATRPTAMCFLLRIAAFGLILSLQTAPAIVIFGLLYGFTFLITAPLTVVFLGNIYGPRRLGTLTGAISMIHQIAGGLGALAGGWIYDLSGNYNPAFALMLALSLAATALTLAVRERPGGERTPLGAAAC